MDASPAIEVRSVRNGRGLVSLRPFATGERIAVIRGRVLPAARVWALWSRDPRRAANCIRFGPEAYLDPHGELGAFANHSCRPNSSLHREGRVLVLRALRRIAAGRELTHDYSTFTGADDVWTMRCNCGEPNCRGLVRSVDRLSAAVRRRYIRRGAIPAFVLATME